MKIETNVPLRAMNTFGVEATARHFAQAESDGDIREALKWAGERGIRVIILGGGSNILFTGDVDALVVRIATKGISILHENGSRRVVEAAAGESWHDLVMWAVANGLGGIENLSLIYGTAGAAPVQNIGAYGVEFRNVCHSVTALNRLSGETREFMPEECEFGYRSSFFKRHAEEWIVLNIRMTLDKAATLKTDYGPLKEKLANRDGGPTFADVAEAVMEVRRSKLPSPEDLGSAGSFFKNPVVPNELADHLLKTYPDMPAFTQNDGSVKLSAAWLLDTAGWKGKRAGDAGCYRLQPLVLVNHGQATGGEILRFSRDIQKDIAGRFGVTLEREAVIYP